MRIPVLLAACAAAMWSASTDAATVVQDVSGSNISGTPLNLFDPALGILTSVSINGSMTWSEAIVRSADAGSPAVNTPRSTTGSLIHQSSGVTITATTLTGSEAYAAGSAFGSLSLGGALFAILTGSDVNQFFVVGSRTTDLLAPLASISPQVGSIMFGPGSPGGTYSVTVTYNYTPWAVPEPSSWAMMMLGFAGIGLVVRYRSRPGRRSRCADNGAGRAC